jgi:hypothetical protein
MIWVTSGHRAVSSMLVGSECELHIMWFGFDPCGACLGGCGCKMAQCCYVNTCRKCSFNQRLILKQV